MKSSLRKKFFDRAMRSLTLFSLIVAASVSHVAAQTTTFAQFFEQLGTQDFGFINNTTSGNFNTVPGGSPVFFLYSNIAGLDPSLQGIQSARLYITTTTTAPGFSSSGTVTQPLNQTVTMQILRDVPAPPGVGGGSRTNLLTAIFTPAGQTPAIVGADGGNSGTLSVTTPDHTVTFTSHFLSFASTTARNLAFSFSSVSPSFSLGGGSFLQTLSAAGSGTFASNPVPVYLGPTAAAVSVGGRVVRPDGQGLANAEVTLREQDGPARVASTDAEGNFRFDGVAGSQSVVLSVRSKRYSYSPQLVTLNDSAFDISFTPNQ